MHQLCGTGLEKQQVHHLTGTMRTCIKNAQASRQQIAASVVPGQMLSSNGDTVLAGCMPRCADSFASHAGFAGPRLCAGACLACPHASPRVGPSRSVIQSLYLHTNTGGDYTLMPRMPVESMTLRRRGPTVKSVCE